jgi:3-isopropylmalate/(R)-2-methylmalate dehydratase large subunit
MSSLSLFEKLWRSHSVREIGAGGPALLYIDRHLVYEVTSPQAFDGLRIAKRGLWRPGSILATCDHNVPTTSRTSGVANPLSRIQIDTLHANCTEYELLQFGLNDPRQGIIHVIAPEQGAILPGMSVAAGDSHTSTHGAFATLAFGIGTSDVEHVLATQCLWVTKMKSMRINVHGSLHKNATVKDLILAIIRRVGAAGAAGYAVEFSGTAITDASMEERMTICNMAVEAGARVSLIGVDEKTIGYIAGRPMAPSGASWQTAEAFWRTLRTDQYAAFDVELHFDATTVRPQVTWGTSPDMVVDVDGCVPDPAEERNAVRRSSIERAISYMGLRPNMPIADIMLNKVFIGSCTNSRIEDLRRAASVVVGKKVADNIKLALVVPGSGLVKQMAEREGLAKIFIDAGFEWREPGCSMCLGMNDDRLLAGERCASTSNRNFEGRQGQGGRTHLVSPQTAAGAAINGRFIDVTMI